MRILPLFIFCVLVFFLWQGLSLDPKDLPSAKIAQKVPNFHLPSVDKKHESLTSVQLHGAVSLLNVWASWCEACNQEQVFLLQLARENIPIYGLNYKDSIYNAKQWLTVWGNPYRMTGHDESGKVAIDFGVYGAPETFLVDAEGIIRYRHAGPLTEAVWTQEFLPRIQKLDAGL